MQPARHPSSVMLLDRTGVCAAGQGCEPVPELHAPCALQALGLGSAMTAHPHVLPAGEGTPQRMVTWVWRRRAPSFSHRA